MTNIPYAIHESYLGHDPRFTGIGCAYDYQVPEGWVIDIDCYTENDQLIAWLIDFEPDLWITHLEEYYEGTEKDIANSKGRHVILIADLTKYLHFKMRWYSEYEYNVCREDYNQGKSLREYIWYYDRSPEMWADCDISYRIRWDKNYEHYKGKEA